MKKKPLVLRICAGCLAVLILCLLGAGILDIYGNPIKKWQLKDDFQSYFDAHFSQVKEDFTCGEVSFNGKFDTYFVTCAYKTQPLLTFSIERTVEGELYDSYSFNIEEGQNFLAMLSNQKFNDLMKRYGENVAELDSYAIRVETPLYQLRPEIQTALYENENVESLPIYSLYLFGKEGSAEFEQGTFVQERFRQMKATIEKTDFVPIHYGASFFDETGNVGYDLIGVRAEIIERDDFAKMIEELKEHPQKYKKEYGFERIDFMEK